METIIRAEGEVEENYVPSGVKMLAGLKFDPKCPLMLLLTRHLQQGLPKKLCWIPLAPEVERARE